jgi:hypothetical protein
MGATDSIQYRIAESIRDAGKLIKTISGYKHNVPDANCLIAPSTMEVPTLSSPAFFVDIDRGRPIEDQGHTIVWDYEYVVSFINVHSGDNPNINDDNKNVIADVIKALKVDVYRGNLAQYTEIGECGPAIDFDTGLLYTFVNVVCRTSVLSTNPYTAVK